MNYRFHPAAEAEYLEQVAYYESCDRGLGARFYAIRRVSIRSSVVPTFAAYNCVHFR